MGSTLAIDPSKSLNPAGKIEILTVKKINSYPLILKSTVKKKLTKYALTITMLALFEPI
jgi:hypothetical protein